MLIPCTAGQRTTDSGLAIKGKLNGFAAPDSQTGIRYDTAMQFHADCRHFLTFVLAQQQGADHGQPQQVQDESEQPEHARGGEYFATVELCVQLLPAGFAARVPLGRFHARERTTPCPVLIRSERSCPDASSLPFPSAARRTCPQ